MTEIRVRVLGPEDWAVYRDVRLAALADAPEAFGSTLAREEALTENEWRGRLMRRGSFLAEEGGEPCGLIGVIPADGPEVAQVVSMWVRPASRGRGVGDLLVREALRRAGELGFRRVRLWVTEGNTAAERLYARHGFQRTGLVQPVREGEDALEFAMVRDTASDGTI